MKRAALILAVFLAGCETRQGVERTAPPPAPPVSPPPSAAPAPPRPKTPLPRVPSAGPLTKQGIEVYMDAAEADLRSYLRGQGVRVARRGNDIVLTVLSDKMFAKAALSVWGDAFARAVVPVFQHFDHMLIEIACYTDARGDAEANLAASQRRAKALAGTLAAYGVAANRLDAKGYGGTAPRSTDPNAALNRRIEIRVKPNPS